MRLQHPHSKMNRHRGFSIIEIVVVLVILGVVSVAITSRVLRADTYNAAIARDQVISLARTAQQKAIGRNDVSLSIQGAGNNFEIRVSDSTGVIESSRVARSSVDVQADVNQLSGCAALAGNTVTDVTSFVLRYTELGDLLEGGVGGTAGITTGARVCINNDPAMSVCVSAAGYAYAGDCIE